MSRPESFHQDREDVYEAMVNSAPQVKLGIASTKPTDLPDGAATATDAELQEAALEMTHRWGPDIYCGGDARSFPLNTLKPSRPGPEVLRLY